MVKIFLFFSDFGQGYLRVWPICPAEVRIFMKILFPAKAPRRKVKMKEKILDVEFSRIAYVVVGRQNG
jgi:hypothetical protein